jgi:hypothetical protein
MLGLFFVIGIGSAAWADVPRQSYDVSNESMTVEYGEYKPVDPAESHRLQSAADNETVNVSGTTLAEGTDYEWNASDGTIIFFDTSATSPGQTAEISYTYQGTTKTAARWGQPIFAIIGVLPVFALVGAFLFVGGFLVWGVRWVGNLSGGVSR